MGAPATAFSSASITLDGNAVITGGGAFLTDGALLFGALLSVATPGAGGVERFSSLELQLEIPKAASSERTRTVKAMREGVHKGFPGLILLFACIS
jgi:hypothetical protein